MTSCGDEKWGDWRPHLAMILSNTSAKSASGSADLDKKSIIAMGDTLSARGFLLAAHFCYLVAQVEFGNYSSKSSKLMLLGTSMEERHHTQKLSLARDLGSGSICSMSVEYKPGHRLAVTNARLLPMILSEGLYRHSTR